MNNEFFDSFEINRPADNIVGGPKTVAQLTDIRAKIRQRNFKHKSKLHHEIAVACKIGVRLSTNRTLWNALVNADWEKQAPPRKKQQPDAVRHVLRFVFGGSPEGRKNASLYSRAVSVLLRDGIEGDAIFQALNKPGGLRALAAQAAQHRKDHKYAESGKVNGVNHGFAPRKEKKIWKMTVTVNFDREPKRLMGLSGTDFPFFTLRGKILELAEPNKMTVLGFPFRFDGEHEGDEG